jgi:prepilin-type N-terminal cleavage/methylation domain-containing protein
MSTTARRATGFTLIEVLVSVTILATGMLILGGLMIRSARSAEAASVVSYQTAIMAAEAARFDAIPFAALTAGTGCDTVIAPPLPRIRCTTVADINAKLKRVTVKVTPTNNALLRPDSVMFERSTGNSSPLYTP